MQIITKIEELKRWVVDAKKAQQKVGFVPTMGYFHEGHLSLMKQARQENELVVVSLFVNPIQFEPQEDLACYPRDLERDQAMAAQVGVDLLFVPESRDMYPDGFQSYVEVVEVSQGLCGGQRLGHFRGVATVVLKLFNLVEANRAYFGEKDAQQLRVIRQMVRDLSVNVEIIGCPIVREADGLAFSSRNVYLNLTERQAALVLSRTLKLAQQLILEGLRDSEELSRKLLVMISQEPLAKLDYLEILESDSLRPISKITGVVLIALAVKIGKTRLIDNLCVTV